MKIGFIGLGNMGFGMATNVLKAGHYLKVYDIRKAAAKPLLDAGAVWAATPKAVAEGCDMVFTSLPGPPEVEEVALGENGIIEGIRPGGIYVDLSTNSPDRVQILYDRFKEKGAHVMDVPVNDGLYDAIEGKLMLMAGGDEDIFQICKPVLDVIGDKVRYFGKIGSGSIVKIVHNCLSFGIQTVVAEGFALGMKAGISPEALYWVISQAAVGRCAFYNELLPAVYLPRRFEPARFSLKLAYKDVDLATSLGRKYNVPMPMTNLTQQELMSAMNKGWGDKDAIIAMLLPEERAGISEVPSSNTEGVRE